MNIDAKWSAARAFHALTLIGGSLFLVIDFFQVCVNGRVKPQPIWMSYLLLLTCLFSGLTLLVLDSDLCKQNQLLVVEDDVDGYEFIQQCMLGIGAKAVISATVFWFVAGLGSVMAYRSRSEYDKSVRNSAEEALLIRDDADNNTRV